LLEWLDPKKAEEAVEARFNEIAERVERATGIPKQTQRELYGLFMQAVKGNAAGGPGLFSSRRRFEAWKSNVDMPKVRQCSSYFFILLLFELLFSLLLRRILILQTQRTWVVRTTQGRVLAVRCRETPRRR
jgi:acyl-CoA-binding protein